MAEQEKISIIDKVTGFVKSNPIAAGAAALGLIFVLPKLLKAGKRRRTRRKYAPATVVRRRRVKRAYTTGGKAKKPWQIKGSAAARRYMARIRKMR